MRLRVFRGFERRERAKTVFTGLQSLSGQTLVVKGFHGFIEASLPMSVYNMCSHLKCIIFSEGIQSLKNGLPGSQKESSRLLGLPVHLIYNYRLLI